MSEFETMGYTVVPYQEGLEYSETNSERTSSLEIAGESDPLNARTNPPAKVLIDPGLKDQLEAMKPKQLTQLLLDLAGRQLYAYRWFTRINRFLLGTFSMNRPLGSQ